MAKIHPNYTSTSTNSSSSNCCCVSSSERETFTVWMKSLVFHGNGCTVFNSRGDVVFRVDNYQQRCSNKVYLMDSNGKVLFTINRKKLPIFGYWEGFKWIGNSRVGKERPWFQVRRTHPILSKDVSCIVNLKSDENIGRRCYKILGVEGKSALKIIDFSGQTVAEATQKQSSSGVLLGEDVLTLMVEANADKSLIMALVTVYGLINKKL